MLNGVYGHELQSPEPQMPFPKDISVFDWSGHPCRTVRTPDMMMTLCACSDDILYATTYQDGTYSLVELQIND